MNKLRLVAITIGLGLITSATQAMAQSPIFHVGSDTRAMTQADCMNRAKFAMGETGLQVNLTAGSHLGGSGADVSVLVTCVSLGQRTFIEVLGASPVGSKAEEFRNRVRSLVMGPAS
jgi:hypothetical protein